MPIARLARTHLVYQSIIFTLVLLVISYYEFLLERKYVLLIAFIPLFIYQLMILGCCMELLHLPGWINLELSGVEDEGHTILPSPEEVKHEEPLQKVDKSVETQLSGENGYTKSRTYKLRNWRSEIDSKRQNAPMHSPHLSLVPLYSKGGDFIFGHRNSNEQQNSELTKKYYFPLREKRLERCIESEGEERPYKIKSWEPRIHDADNFAEKDLEPTSLTSDSTSAELKLVSRTSPPPSEFTKSYSFPFRYKRLQEWAELKGNLKQESEHQVPYLQTVAGKSPRCRKALSSFHLNEDLELEQESHQFKDFTQSLELAPDSSVPTYERNAHKEPYTSFTKMRAGLSNYFTKIKRRNSNPKSAPDAKAKRLSFKSLFHSKENLHAKSSRNEDRKVLKRLESKDASYRFYTGYIPCENDSFDKNVQKTILELSRTQI